MELLVGLSVTQQWWSPTRLNSWMQSHIGRHPLVILFAKTSASLSPLYTHTHMHAYTHTRTHTDTHTHTHTHTHARIHTHTHTHTHAHNLSVLTTSIASSMRLFRTYPMSTSLHGVWRPSGVEPRCCRCCSGPWKTWSMSSRTGSGTTSSTWVNQTSPYSEHVASLPDLLVSSFWVL